MIDACMISRKGKVIPVESNPYIDYDIVIENVKMTKNY